MIEATSCGGVVIHRGKILALYKSYKNRYEGWVLPKGTVEPGERNFSWTPGITSFTRFTICFVLQTRSRSLRRRTRNIWNCEVPDYGTGSRNISDSWGE